MSDLTTSEYGTSVQSYPLVTDYNSYMQEFLNDNMRLPVNVMKRFYMNFNLSAAVVGDSPYVIGILPIKAYLVSFKHVCKTVTAAGTLEIELGSKSSISTAQAAAITVSTAVLTTTVADRLGAAGDIIGLVVATASAALVDVAIELIFEPYR